MAQLTLSSEGFSFGRLWNDKEARSVIIQILTMALLVAFLAYIVTNAIANLESIGKTFSFGFLNEPASYDINQTLIPYTSRSTHLQAAIVGLLNTLLVAVCGIVLTTLLGFAHGVLQAVVELAGQPHGLLLDRDDPQRAVAAPHPADPRHHRHVAAAAEAGPRRGRHVLPLQPRASSCRARSSSRLFWAVFVIAFWWRSPSPSGSSKHAHKVQDRTGKHLPGLLGLSRGDHRSCR